MGCVSSKPSQKHDKKVMISLGIKAPLPQCAIEDNVPTEHHPTICTILLEAVRCVVSIPPPSSSSPLPSSSLPPPITVWDGQHQECMMTSSVLFDFQSTYWQQALGCFPEPQVQMVRVIRNCSENTMCNVVLTLNQSSGAMQFVDNLDQFSVEELFFWVAKEELGVQTKYLLVNANRTHVICIQHPDVTAQHISTISASDLCSQNKYYFELPTEDVQDNTLLMAFNPEQCSTSSLEYEEARRRPTMGAQQFRFNIQSVTYLPLPKCTNTMSCNPAT